MATASKKQTQEMQDELEALRADMAALKDTMSDYAKSQKSHLRAVATDSIQDAAAYGSAKAEEVRAAASSKYAETEDAVRSNPAAAVGIAAGLGFLVGMIATRRS